jgi:hypothetical protein
VQHFDLSIKPRHFSGFFADWREAKVGRNEQRIFNWQRPESNVTFERTPLAALAAAPHWSACMSGSNTIFTPSSDSLFACHKRKLPAGVTLNFFS